jgi:glycosyltransferase involved in cell wall biosynthesis
VRPEIILGYTRWANVGCGLTWRWSTAGIFIWGQRGVNSLFGDAIERRAYHRASAVICNAEHEVEYLHRTLGKAAGPVYVVHNGVQLEPCQKSRGEWRRELGIHKDAIVATMVANFGHYKDHPTLLRAWRSAIESQSERKNGYRLLIAGFPHSIVCFEAAKRLIIELEIEDWVIILGQVRDVSGLLAASDIGVLASGTAKIDGLSAFSQPSFAQEGLSNSVLEYMASGLPVIATDLPGNREALGDNPIQPLFKLGNSEGLAARLKSLLNDPGLRRELGEMNKQRALTKFSVESMCGKSAGIITDLLSSQSSNIQKPRTKE